MPKKILLIADYCLDQFIYGSCVKLSPEAPVIDFKPEGEPVKNGGMGMNVLHNLISLKPDDWEIIPVFNEEEITKTRYIDSASKQHLLRVSEEPKVSPIKIEELSRFTNDKDLICIVVSDYAKGFITEQFIIDLLNTFEKIPVILDTKKRLGDWSRDVDFIKINQKEYELTKDTADCCVNLIVTMGKNGSKWINRDLVVPTEPVEMADFCGAGDTYLAAFAVNYLQFFDIQKAMKYGNEAARVAVSKRGVAVVGKEEIA